MIVEELKVGALVFWQFGPGTEFLGVIRDIVPDSQERLHIRLGSRFVLYEGEKYLDLALDQYGRSWFRHVPEIILFPGGEFRRVKDAICYQKENCTKRLDFFWFVNRPEDIHLYPLVGWWSQSAGLTRSDHKSLPDPMGVGRFVKYLASLGV